MSNEGRPTSAGPGEASESEEAVCLRMLPRAETLDVETENSHYHIVLTDPWTRRARVQGGHDLPEPTEATLVGATYGYGLLKPGWISVGLSMEILTRDRYFVTSPVRAIHRGHRQPDAPDPAPVCPGAPI